MKNKKNRIVDDFEKKLNTILIFKYRKFNPNSLFFVYDGCAKVKTFVEYKVSESIVGRIPWIYFHNQLG